VSLGILSAPCLQIGALAQAPSASSPALPPEKGLTAWAGLTVTGIQFEGVSETMLTPLPAELAQQAGEPLDPGKVRDSLRRLYATGLYQTIQVSGVRTGNNVSLVFSGVPRHFIARINIDGVSDDRLAVALSSSTQLQAGTAYTEEKALQAGEAITKALEDNGYYRAKISTSMRTDAPNALETLDYRIVTGPPARVGNLQVQGESGLTEQQFRSKGKLRRNSKVNRNTVSRALTRLHKDYSKQGRVAAVVSLASTQYVPATNRVNYGFLANQGPLVKVVVEGAKIGEKEVRKLVPIYEEDSVDQDLLNEGAQNLRSYFQSRGFYEAQVSQSLVNSDPRQLTAIYTVKLGRRHIVESVSVSGNKYFSRQIIEERLNVRRADFVDRHGAFSQQLLNQDVASIKALYQSNGFSNVSVTPKVIDRDAANGVQQKLAHLEIAYQIEEGAQQRVGKYEILGAQPEDLEEISPRLSTQTDQPYSAANLSADRDLVTTYYLSRGYDNADVELFQQNDPANKNMVDVTMRIVPGPRSFVRQVITSGRHFTRPAMVDDRIQLKPGQPLNQTALLDTQRELYDLGLFNEVDTAIENPDGDEAYKNVLLNLTEAKRWDFNYGFGFEAQTGTPTEGCLSVANQILLGIQNSYKCTPNGHLGASPRVLFNVSRINLRGTDQSITLQTNFGTLEQVALLTYQSPRIFGWPGFSLTLSGGYDNSANISTYRAAVSSGSLRISERVNRANHLIYSFSYRRVAVNPSTLQVSLAEIPLLAQPVRVGGPGVTWIRDTRDEPLNAHRGSLTSVEQFLADGGFGSEANYNRIDATNATYYQFGRDHWVFARQTRYGQERAYGNGVEELIPLPERLYAGGATSLRSFPLNTAGPRDPQTGYPIGGAGAFVNSFELRTPPPNLPYFGTDVSFVLFHDMGNVFEHSSEIWPSMFRVRQPHSQTCRDVTVPYITYNTPETCDFNDFSHALGLGLRYRTPIGPVRVDFSDNLNPPIYPVIYDYTTNSSTPNPHVGQAGHFNFFFSIGQSF
jgi:outer membrane protein assembly complex protein YaeT